MTECAILHFLKIFDGNIDDNALRRNGLITSPLAKFIRFYPVTYSGSKALRVEVYGYAQGMECCNTVSGLGCFSLTRNSKTESKS